MWWKNDHRFHACADRQKGRIKAASVIDCRSESDAIFDAIQDALALDCSMVDNPYGDGNTSQRIIEILKSFPEPGNLVRKSFHDM